MRFSLEHAIPVLSRTPGVLDRLLRDLPEEWLHGTEGPETWSPYGVVGHLIHGERTDWMARARIILEHGETRTFDRFDRFAQLRESEGKSIGQLLDAFAALRAENLRALEALKLEPEQLRKTGTHPAFGRVTLEQLLATWVAHDMDHLAQIARVMAKQYAAAVGPWKEYLSILSDRPRA